MQQKSSGFSLVELAIVLVIIGLIVGGILTGQELIKASELNAVATETNKVKTAIHSFKLKYNGLPGDLKNATSYWSGTANGGNDNQINPTAESARAWQHLGLSGLIPGSYTGVVTDPLVGGTNAKSMPYKDGIMVIRFGGNSDATCVKRQNNLEIGVANTGAGAGLANSYLFVPSEAYSIDAKYDDGEACKGQYRGVGNSGCATWTATSGAYDLSSTTVDCTLNVSSGY